MNQLQADLTRQITELIDAELIDKTIHISLSDEFPPEFIRQVGTTKALAISLGYSILTHLAKNDYIDMPELKQV